MRRYFRAVLGEVHKKDAEKKREKRLEKYRGGGVSHCIYWRGYA